MPGDALESKADLLRRLRCAEGHLRGIAAMIERGADCQSVVHQILAVQAALRVWPMLKAHWPNLRA